MSGNEDDRHVGALGELPLQLEAVEPGKGDIEQQTTRNTTRGRERKSCPDANVSARQPALLISSSSDSRTEISSSTTKTIDVRSGMVTYRHGTGGWRAPISTSSECGIECIEQSRVAEGLEKAFDGAFGDTLLRIVLVAAAVIKTMGIICRRVVNSC